MTFQKKNSIGDSVADEMATLIDSDEYRAIFSKPMPPKLAAKKEKEDDKKADKKAPKHNHPGFKPCTKKCPAMKKKKADDINETIEKLSGICELLDSHGLVKSASVALKGLEQLVAEAEEMCAKDEKEDEMADENDASDKAEEDKETAKEEDKNDAHDQGDEGKAEAPEQVGEELRALLSELGLGGEGHDENNAVIVVEDGHDHDHKDLDHDFDEDYADVYDLPKSAEYREEFIKVAAKKAAPKGDFVFGKDHPKVKDNKDHFPLNTRGRGANALAQASKFKKVPSWYKGSLEELVSAVQRAVKKKYKGIETTKASKKPGPG